MSLLQYKQKRNFESTPEPRGSKKSVKHSLRFVIQEHHARALHFDFRLEYNGVLVSFAIPKNLPQKIGQKHLAVLVEDHPLDYIDFEGIIPKGNYGAGSVQIWDKGYYTIDCNLEQGLQDGKFAVCLAGDRLNGCWTFVKTAKNWLVLKNDIKNLPFDSASVMLAMLKTSVPMGQDWIYEIKYDGFRMLAFCQNKIVVLKSRGNIDYTKKFKNIAQSLSKIFEKTNAVLDGEVVSFDEDGKSDFALLNTNMRRGNQNFVYVVFDVLACNGEDVRDKTLSERKALLYQIIGKTNATNLHFCEYLTHSGKDCFLAAQNLGLEGIVAKKMSSSYSSGRSEDWIKIKCYYCQEFVITGFATTKQNSDLSALALAVFDGKKFVYMGMCGTGFDEEQRKKLAKTLKKYATDKNCMDKQIKNINFVKPHIVAQIKFANITRSGLLRQPVFVELRKDKKAKEVRLETKYNIKNLV